MPVAIAQRFKESLSTFQTPKVCSEWVSGWEESLGIDDLEDDPILIRKIKRVQRAKQLREERLAAGEDIDDVSGQRRRMEEISDGEGAGGDADDIDDITATQQQQQQRIKRERIVQNDDEIEEVSQDGDGFER